MPTGILTAVEGTTAPLKRVHYVERSHSLALRVLGIGDAVSDNLVQIGQSHPPLDPRATHPLKEVLQDCTGLLIDEARDTLHCPRCFRLPHDIAMSNDALTSSTTSETTNGWLGDTLDVVTQDFTMTFRTRLCEDPIAISNALLTLLIVQHSARE